MKINEICNEKYVGRQVKDGNGAIWMIVKLINDKYDLEDRYGNFINYGYSLSEILELDFELLPNIAKLDEKYDGYYNINDRFRIIDNSFNLVESASEYYRCGNMYPYTNENKDEVLKEVELIAKRKKLQSQIEQFARENEENKVNLNDCEIVRWSIDLNHIAKDIDLYASYCRSSLNTPYFSSEEVGNKVINKFGDKIKDLYFNNEE